MEVLYNLWLHSICDFEPDKVEKAIVLFEGSKNRFSSRESDIQMLKNLGLAADLKDRFSDPEFFAQARRIADYCESNQIRIVSQESDEYPEFLKHISIPPKILFVKGARIDWKNSLAVSVVGSRKPSPHGKSVARQLGKKLAENGIVVVSGMAEGIDGEAHRGALEAGGKTVAVLAGSVDVIYPRSHERLYYDILKNGTIISERPPGTVVQRYFYQQRNRLVVGLSHGTVVVEGEENSGTSMTARIALDNNRDIFAVPGNPLVPQAELPNRLISEGAMIVDKIERPVEYYKEIRPEYFKEQSPVYSEPEKKVGLSEEDAQILQFIRDNGGIADAEELAENCRISPSILASKLTILCIRGFLRQESGNRYVLINIV